MGIKNKDVRHYRHLLFLLPLVLVAVTRGSIGESQKRIWDPREGVMDIFGPKLAYEFVNADSSVRHTLAILSMTNDSIRFVLMRQTTSEVLEYSGYATRDKEVNAIDSFLTKGEGYFVAIEISKNREHAEVVYFDDRRVEVERATPDEIVLRHENAR